MKGALAEALDAFYNCLDQQRLADLVDNGGGLAALLEDRS